MKNCLFTVRFKRQWRMPLTSLLRLSLLMYRGKTPPPPPTPYSSIWDSSSVKWVRDHVGLCQSCFWINDYNFWNTCLLYFLFDLVLCVKMWFWFCEGWRRKDKCWSCYCFYITSTLFLCCYSLQYVFFILIIDYFHLLNLGYGNALVILMGE